MPTFLGLGCPCNAAAQIQLLAAMPWQDFATLAGQLEHSGMKEGGEGRKDYKGEGEGREGEGEVGRGEGERREGDEGEGGGR